MYTTIFTYDDHPYSMHTGEYSTKCYKIHTNDESIEIPSFQWQHTPIVKVGITIAYCAVASKSFYDRFWYEIREKVL